MASLIESIVEHILLVCITRSPPPAIPKHVTPSRILCNTRSPHICISAVQLDVTRLGEQEKGGGGARV